MKKNIQILDTTLRDGEQTYGVSFTKDEKLLVTEKLLKEIKVDRVEFTSAKVSPEEQINLKEVMNWAVENNFINNIEVLSFIDKTKSVDWILPTGCKNLNLLSKGSKKHCECQLNKTPQEHLKDIRETYNYASANGLSCSIYLEDWSGGMLAPKEYIYYMLDAYSEWNVFKKLYLADTLGILNTESTFKFVSEIVEKYPKLNFEFHGHNDYGLATANAVSALRAGASGVHVTVNGLGERAGNASLAEIIVNIKDHLEIEVPYNEKKLKDISQLVSSFSRKRVSSNCPIVGQDVFTQTAGIHADGDKKGNLYASNLTPDRFGANRVYALGKLSGKSNIEMNLRELGLTLTDEQKKILLNKVVELGDKKEIITTGDLQFMVLDILGDSKSRIFEIIECVITSTLSMKPFATIRVKYKDKIYNAVGEGNGGYDAFMKAMESISAKAGFKIPKLQDYEVHIPTGGNTDALVEAVITWDNGMKTHAVSSDQVMAALLATEKIINLTQSRFSN
jgi:D-citramalate synthase